MLTEMVLIITVSGDCVRGDTEIPSAQTILSHIGVVQEEPYGLAIHANASPIRFHERPWLFESRRSLPKRWRVFAVLERARLAAASGDVRTFRGSLE